MNIHYPADSSTKTVADLYRLGPDDLPTWRSNMVGSLNGAVEIDDLSKGLSSEADRRVFWILRAYADAVIIGASTAISEGYTSIAPLTPDLISLRNTGDAPILVVVTKDPTKLEGSNLIQSDREIILVTSSSARANVTALADSFKVQPKVLVVGTEEPDIGEARIELERVGLRHAVLEGGPRFLGLCLMASVIDEIALTIAPILAKNQFAGFLGPSNALPTTKLKLESLIEDNGSLLTRYKIDKKE